MHNEDMLDFIFQTFNKNASRSLSNLQQNISFIIQYWIHLFFYYVWQHIIGNMKQEPTAKTQF